MGTSAILLSGGRSARFGGFPKAALDLGGRPAIARMADVAEELGFDPVIAVAGAHVSEVRQCLAGTRAEVVESSHWSEGRTASVQDALRAVPPAQDVLLWPVDHPLVRSETIERLIAARDLDPLAVWFIPEWEGHGGHPVLWRPAVRPAVLALSPSAPLRSLLPYFGPQVRRVPTVDPGVAEPIDTPFAYESAMRRTLNERRRG